MELQFKTLTVHIAGGAETFKLALLPGSEPAALLDAARGRMGQGIMAASIFLTLGPDPSGVVVPLSAALPDGAELTLHRRAGPDATAPQPPAQSYIAELPTMPRRGRSPGRAAPVIEANVMSSEYDTDSVLGASLLGPESRVSDSEVSQVGPFGGTSSTPLLADDATELTQDLSKRSNEAALEKKRSRSGSALRKVLKPFTRSAEQFDEDRKANKDIVDAIEKFSRIGTDMGNERTLLAWIRTSLAAVRTVFTFYGLQGTSGIWSLTILSSEWSMCFLCIITAVLGHTRYVRMKEVIEMKVTPGDYHRISLRWVFWVTMISMVLASIGSIVYTFGPILTNDKHEGHFGWTK